MSIFKHTYSGLITGGLGNPACCGMITMQFHLFKCKIEIITPPVSGGGGGSYPLGPGQIQNFYKPVNPDKFYTPRKPLYQTIILRVTIDGKTTVREYKTFPVIAKAIANIINITNVVFDSINVRVQTIKTKFKDLVVGIKNIGNKEKIIAPKITDVKNKE